MANGTSAFATAYDAARSNRTMGPLNLGTYQQGVLLLVRPIVILGTETTGAYHDLGPVLMDNVVVIPELCRVRWKTGAVTSLSTTATLQKVDNAAANLTALTGLATLTGITVADGFLDFAAATTAPVCRWDDRLRIYFTTVTTISATEAGTAADVEIAVRSINT